MGFCYEGRKLVCDVCGTAGARKRKCPFGYCTALAVCKTCWSGPKFAKGAWKASHKTYGCDVKHAEFVAREAKRAARVEAGEYLRVAAKNVDTGAVHVLFTGKLGTIGFFMSPATYAALPLGTDASPDDFRKLGPLTSAPTEFSWTS